jgi:hypothetical protein
MRIKDLMFIALTAALLFGAGCRRYPTPILEEIEPHQTAFLITLEGGQADQARFASVEYLESTKVAAKRITIPQQWVKTGYGPLAGKWVPTQRLIRVDRSPVPRRWTGDATPRASTSRQVLEAESRDSIGVNSGFAITAWVTEEDTARFLYHYPNGQLASIVDNQIFNDVQSVYSEVAAKYNVSELRARKDEINEAIRQRLLPDYASRGITISPSLGLIGGLMYDNDDIQKAIDAVFISQNLEEKAEAERRAQLVENQRALSVETTLAAQRQVRADAEAYEIRVKTEAIAEGGPAYIRVRSLEVLAEAITKWSGDVPRTLSAGGGGSLLFHEMLND